MPIFYTTRSWWDSLSDKNRELLCDTLYELRIGQPAFYELAGNEYAVWSDPRITPRYVARVGRDLKDIADRSLIVVPVVVDGDDEYEVTMEAQGGPSQFKARAGLPPNAVPIDPEE